MKIVNNPIVPCNTYKNNNVNFQACFSKNVDHSKKWSWDKLAILDRSESEMNDVAEYLYKKSDWKLEQKADGNTYAIQKLFMK